MIYFHKNLFDGMDFYMINGCLYRGRNLKFHTGNVNLDKNIFTTIVGRNGSGKSRLLRELVNSFANVTESRREREVNESPNLCHVDGERPSNIIASSTSPFDKFPIPYERGAIDVQDGYYFYQGMRGLASVNLSLSFMSEILGFLIKALTYDSTRVGTVMGVLDYLGYQEKIVARFIVEVPRSLVMCFVHGTDPISELDRFFSVNSKGTLNTRKLRSLFVSSSPEEVSRIVAALKDYFVNFERPRIDAVISSTGAVDALSGRLLSDHFTVLLDAGLLRLRDVTLTKKGLPNFFKINDASSGEQCVLMALLGIAANIQDGSLICIDEPEICLHPEWQERYIQLLMTTFSEFKGCHFVIATHSPQIISKLADTNCFVLDMQSARIYNANEFNNRSADFQLASIFGAPGYKNEYLMRELLNALTVLGTGRNLSAEQMRVFSNFLDLKDVLEEDDPVKDLLVLLEDALEAKNNARA